MLICCALLMVLIGLLQVSSAFSQLLNLHNVTEESITARVEKAARLGEVCCWVLVVLGRKCMLLTNLAVHSPGTCRWSSPQGQPTSHCSGWSASRDTSLRTSMPPFASRLWDWCSLRIRRK
jgi:hypothetical protein